MSSPDPALAVAAERQLADPATRRDPAAVSALLADDFTEIGASGRLWTRAEVIADLAAESMTREAVDTADWTVRELAPGIAMVSYVSLGEGSRVRRTSLYRVEFGRWRAFFHQGTPEL